MDCKPILAGRVSLVPKLATVRGVIENWAKAGGQDWCVLRPYSGKLSREKTCTNFTVLWLYAKVFP